MKTENTILTEFRTRRTEEKGGITKSTKNMKDYGKTQEKTNDTVKKGKKGFRDINFEFLGVMFLGQAMTKTFSELLTPAADMFGIFDLISITLADFFMPIMEAILPVILNLMDTIMAMSPATKLLIGKFALFGLGLGKVLGVVGQVVLGVQAVGIAFSSIILIVAIVGIAVLAAVKMWKSNFGGFKDAVKNAFQTIKKIIAGVMDFVTAMMEGDFESAADSIIVVFKNLGVLLWNIFKNVFFVWIPSLFMKFIGLLGALISKIPFLKKLGLKISAGATSSLEKINEFGKSINTPYETNDGNSNAGITQNITNNVQVTDKTELEKMFDGFAKKQADETQRIVSGN